jgi:gentisate 1,2-dioxygenase
VAIDTHIDEQAARRAYYDRIAGHSLKPLWEVLAALVPAQPATDAVPALWRWRDVAPFIAEAGSLITAREAERRVLILENPGLPGQSTTTSTMYAGLQLILPGEVAPAHRHTQSALRFVVDGEGAYTAVDGERVTMSPGDFIVTPMWTWHDHGNPGTQPVTWLDGLDIAVVRMLGAQFRENHGHEAQPVSRPEGDAAARYGANMLPLGYEKHTPASPIFNYPYDRSRAALEAMRHQNEWDPCHGLRMRYINPVNGDWAMPSIGTTLQLLPKGFDTQAYRSTDATGFVAVEGRGHSIVAGQRIDWGSRDVFIVPSWHEVTHHPAEDSVLFGFSDRPIQEKLGLHREQRGNH